MTNYTKVIYCNKENNAVSYKVLHNDEVISEGFVDFIGYTGLLGILLFPVVMITMPWFDLIFMPLFYKSANKKCDKIIKLMEKYNE